MRERLLRAAAALAAGAAIALEHLRDREQPEPLVVPPVMDPCPMCPGSLRDGPHFHDQDVYWLTEHPGAILMTDLHGGDSLVIGGQG